MKDLNSLDGLTGKYVSITEPDGGGMSGWLERADDIVFHEGHYGREVMMDYGMGWFVTESTSVREEDPPGRVGVPVAEGDLGLLLYGGGPIRTPDGETIRVKESSFGGYPHVWLHLEKTGAVNLSLVEAIALRKALDQFIELVPDRWNGGQEKLDAAEAVVRGEKP